MAASGNASRGEFLLRELPAIVEPTHGGNGTAQITREVGGVPARDGQIFTLGDFEFSGPKAARECHRACDPSKMLRSGSFVLGGMNSMFAGVSCRSAR